MAKHLQMGRREICSVVFSAAITFRVVSGSLIIRVTGGGYDGNEGILRDRSARELVLLVIQPVVKVHTESIAGLGVSVIIQITGERVG